MSTHLSPDMHLYLIQSKAGPLTLAAFAGYALASAAVGLSARDPGFGSLNTGLVTLAFLAGVVNAAMSLLLFPWLFATVSRLYGAPTETSEIRAISALSLAPVIVATLLGTALGAPVLTALASLLALAVFVHGLALANGTTHTGALTHTLAVFVTLLVFLTAVALVLAAAARGS